MASELSACAFESPPPVRITFMDDFYIDLPHRCISLHTTILFCLSFYENGTLLYGFFFMFS